MSVNRKIQQTVAFLNKEIGFKPQTGLVLGSGLGDFASRIEAAGRIPYGEIPNFPESSVPGHEGAMVFGEVSGRKVVILKGRVHFYEGYALEEVVFPVRVLCALGISELILTNAAGGINPQFSAGDLMVITDHMNLMGQNPLRGKNPAELGPRFPDMSAVYQKDLIEIIATEMTGLGLADRSGVYAAMTGPSYETPAEVRMLAFLGADAVGMSTVPEAIAARHMGVAVAGISCITNLAAGISAQPLSHDEVTETADRVREHFIRLLTAVLGKLGN